MNRRMTADEGAEVSLEAPPVSPLVAAADVALGADRA